MLTGSHATSNLLPISYDHDGVLHIISGTGVYEVASGQCVVTDWVANGNTLSGSVTCDSSPK